MEKETKLKVGDEITMFFHGAGVVSKEKFQILKFDDNTVTIDDGDDGDDGRKFNRKTGKCLNDNNFMGFYRTIKPC